MPGVVEKTAYERQVFGQLSLRAPFQFDAEQFGGRAADVESARFERRPHPVGMAAGEPFRPGAASFGAVEAASDVGECPSSVAALQREEPPFDPYAFGAEQPPGLGEGESLFAGRDLRGDEQRRAVPQPLLRGVLREGRAAPAAAVVGASAAIGGDVFRVAEAGGVFGGPYSGRMRSCGKISRFRGHRCAERKLFSCLLPFSRETAIFVSGSGVPLLLRRAE